MDDLVDNTILHELVHTWIAKGKSPKQIAFNKSWMTPLGKAARRARRDKRRALWVGKSGEDSVIGLKTTWQLEKDVEDQNVKGAKLDSDDFESSSYLKSDDDMKIPKDDMKERAFYKGYYGKKT